MKAVYISLSVLALILSSGPLVGQANDGPLQIEISEGVPDPLPIAIAHSITTDRRENEIAGRIEAVIASDLTNTGLFRVLLAESQIAQLTNIDAPVAFADWTAAGAQALLVTRVSATGTRIRVSFRLFDVLSEESLGDGLEIVGNERDWRRVAHKIADVIYSRISGESGYFDSRVAFISETGSKDNRSKQLGLMDYDGENLRFLTTRSDQSIIINPRFSPDGASLIYTAYDDGRPRVRIMDIASGRRRSLLDEEIMAFSPRFSPDGGHAVMSVADGPNVDIHEVDLSSGASRALTRSTSIDTSASYSPDGKWIAFESDRSGSQQIYVMNVAEGDARRVTFNTGRYGTPAWSPRGDLIAFTKQQGGRFHIGVISPDGRGERLLTASFLDEGPSWSPNGRVLMFFRESPGDRGGPQLMSVDVNGRNLRTVRTPAFASDPAWSPLRN